ncbi:hypothetical protein H2201_004870 [Coniosporium apollinis]|uniref:DUF2423 domain-containing protein n=1 Tax=Coniosporium apollinis TaxID=61459 RepID=A0ABQ9NTM7_9PEZI|nr:hypothetical protein H2201_004870 [Coniosporium apollinis]
MAQGLRSSVKKTNRSKLRTRVFAPVEDARTERLSAKLLELASQPRPAKTEMEVEEDATKAETQPQADADTAAQAEGWLPCFTCRIPQSLSPKEEGQHQAQKRKHKQAKKPNPHRITKDETFYHILGLSSDIIGFDAHGDLVLDFSNMEVDDAPAAKATSSSKSKKKTGRIQKKRRAKSASSITFPTFQKGAKAGPGKRGKR